MSGAGRAVRTSEIITQPSYNGPGFAEVSSPTFRDWQVWYPVLMSPARRIATLLVIGVALLGGQYGAQRHALTHLQHDLAVAKYGKQSAPPVGHALEECVAYDSISSVAGPAAPWILPSTEIVVAAPRLAFFDPPPARIELNARAPPPLSALA